MQFPNGPTSKNVERRTEVTKQNYMNAHITYHFMTYLYVCDKF